MPCTPVPRLRSCRVWLPTSSFLPVGQWVGLNHERIVEEFALIGGDILIQDV